MTLVVKRGKKTRRVKAKGTTRFSARVRLKPGRYLIASRARTPSGVEPVKRGKRVRVKK